MGTANGGDPVSGCGAGLHEICQAGTQSGVPHVEKYVHPIAPETTCKLNYARLMLIVFPGIGHERRGVLTHFSFVLQEIHTYTYPTAP